MAKTNIDKIWKQIEKDFIGIVQNAAVEVAERAKDDIEDKANQFIDEYYSEYTPRRYKRKMALKNLMEDYWEESKTKKGITIEFGIKYNPENIEGIHKSNSWYRQSGTVWNPRLSGDFDFDSANNGIPQARWITEKFLEGVHPSGKIGNDGGAKFTSSDEKMQDFFDKELNNKIKSYMNEALLSAIKNYF